MRIVGLGASGHAGSAIAAMLAPELDSTDELVLAGRNEQRLAKTRQLISGPARVSTAIVDVEDQSSVRELVHGADLVIVTVSRPDLIESLGRIVLEAGSDWIDTMLSTPTKIAALRSLGAEITAADRCFVTDGGFHPGLPATLVRWAGAQFDELTEADVTAGLRIDWHADAIDDSTIEEMLTEFTDFDMVSWIDGARRRVRWSECPSVDFGEPLGLQRVIPMGLAEMLDLPEQYPGLQRCGFYITGFSPAMDYLGLPVVMAMATVPALHRTNVRFVRWAMTHLARSRPPYRLVLQSQARGLAGGAPAQVSIRLAAEDSYLLTAAPVVACVNQLRHSGVRRAGLHFQAHLLEPEACFADLARLGVEVHLGEVTPI